MLGDQGGGRDQDKDDLVFDRTAQSLQARAAVLLVSIETRLDRIMQLWLLMAGLACAVRIATSPPTGAITPGTLLPFLLLITAPFASMVLALRWFDDGGGLPQPRTRLSRLGRWRDIGRARASRHALYGPGGIMVSLLVGMLVNVPVRALEYLAAMPAMPETVPGWLGRLHLLLTFDAVLFCSLYAIAFVAALRKVPLFPRLLVAIWCVDVAMQLLVAAIIAQNPGLPANVGAALQALLQGNVQKVLISAALWLPYLLLSKRVNVTYRHRIAV
jgi:hypothetical protein